MRRGINNDENKNDDEKEQTTAERAARVAQNSLSPASRARIDAADAEAEVVLLGRDLVEERKRGGLVREAVMEANDALERLVVEGEGDGDGHARTQTRAGQEEEKGEGREGKREGEEDDGRQDQDQDGGNASAWALVRQARLALGRILERPRMLGAFPGGDDEEEDAKEDKDDEEEGGDRQEQDKVEFEGYGEGGEGEEEEGEEGQSARPRLGMSKRKTS
jgi:hypothetical protein